MGLRPLAFFATVLLLLSCNTPSPPRPIDAAIRLRSIDTWAIQLSGLERPGAADRIARSDADLLVLDRPQTTKKLRGWPTRTVLAQARARRPRIGIAYVNAAQAERYRTYWRRAWRPGSGEGPGDPGFLLGPDPDGWEGNFMVRYWDPAWRGILFGGPESFVDGAIDDGFDGVMLDWVAAWADPGVRAQAAREEIDAADAMVGLIRDLAAHARARKPGFVVLLQGGASLVAERPEVAKIADGIVQESVWFAGSPSSDWEDPANADRAQPEAGTADVLALLEAAKSRGLAVLTLDYASDPEKVAAAEERSRAAGFLPCTSRTPLDRIP
jgi:cysteinyl-tRNA synthetase